jgi:predicted RNase H-like HicB family nuclease
MRKKKGKRMTRKFHVIIERDEDGYFVGYVPELPGCHTQAKSLDTLQERLKEAIRLYLEVETGIPENLQFVGIQQIEVPL